MVSLEIKTDEFPPNEIHPVKLVRELLGRAASGEAGAYLGRAREILSADWEKTGDYQIRKEAGGPDGERVVETRGGAKRVFCLDGSGNPTEVQVEFSGGKISLFDIHLPETRRLVLTAQVDAETNWRDEENPIIPTTKHLRRECRGVYRPILVEDFSFDREGNIRKREVIASQREINPRHLIYMREALEREELWPDGFRLVLRVYEEEFINLMFHPDGSVSLSEAPRPPRELLFRVIKEKRPTLRARLQTKLAQTAGAAAFELDYTRRSLQELFE